MQYSSFYGAGAFVAVHTGKWGGNKSNYTFSLLIMCQMSSMLTVGV